MRHPWERHGHVAPVVLTCGNHSGTKIRRPWGWMPSSHGLATAVSPKRGDLLRSETNYAHAHRSPVITGPSSRPGFLPSSLRFRRVPSRVELATGRLNQPTELPMLPRPWCPLAMTPCDVTRNVFKPSQKRSELGINAGSSAWPRMARPHFWVVMLLTTVDLGVSMCLWGTSDGCGVSQIGVPKNGWCSTQDDY